MTQPMKVARGAMAGAGALALVAGLAGPAFASKASRGLYSGVKKDKALAARVIPSIRHRGTLIVAADASYAPNEFIGAGKVVGMDPDLAKALGLVLGLKVQVVNETFDGIIPGLQAKKYDLGMSSFTDNTSREKVVDFVDYFSAGTSFFVKASGGPDIAKLADLCGHSVSVETGTTQQSDAKTQSTACVKAGKKPVSVDAFTDQNGANLALLSGRDQVSMADSPVAAYQVKKSHGGFKLSGSAYGTAPYGIAIPKHDGMAPVVAKALKELIADGAYLRIMDKWGIEAGAVKTVAINGAHS